ncbi:diguanylate cyclase domain-containing protein [Planctomycetes bacterium K23_9]|uniref:diguanylate cyclase n=1 Tax=Stieleria marina TaxID=1930275 RepID=A0A517P0A4_9BACT|nr:putative diguanylate cyclase YdaM [Planctomycetes bacterium K23_9]
MTDTTGPATANASSNASPLNATKVASASLQVAAEASQDDVSRLLGKLQETAPRAKESRQPTSTSEIENQLAVVRLGMATSLYYSLRTKHAPTAAHCLRVSLTCSAWASRMGLESEGRDRIEVAALLHDLGKIGVPDRILRKPSKLDVNEQLAMDCCPQIGCEILRGCTSDQELLNIVRHANTWYQSRRREEFPQGDALPLGARMLSIAGAFDAMTTEHVYRAAMSREQAINCLIEGSGSQFDPELVADFARMLEAQPEMLHGAVVDRWLRRLQTNQASSKWSDSVDRTSSKPNKISVRRETHFHDRLLRDLKDGVVFTDSEGIITHWNATMVKMTGIATDAIIGKSWNAKTLRLQSPASDANETTCPLRECYDRSAPVTRAMMLDGTGDEPTSVQVQVSPVSGSKPGILGSVIIIHDNSFRADLEEQLVTLHHKTTMDALTGVSNRAHFDETLDAMVQSTSKGESRFSLVICDIDHFKRVNDVHGHPAGDEALINFAHVLRQHSREGDLVARYGGEEFLLLAANCDNATAAKRADAIRQALETTVMPSLGGECVTASFGVTEYQPGDTAETVLARSDRALLKAKDNGRNRVVQLGSGGGTVDMKAPVPAKSGWFSWFDSSSKSTDAEVDILTPVPADLAIEKLKGFIADHSAEIISVDESQVSLKIHALSMGGRRRIDQHIGLRLDLTLSEARQDELGTARKSALGHSKIHVILTPLRNRDRRSSELQDCVDNVIASLRSYLMGEIMAKPVGE